MKSTPHIAPVADCGGSYILLNLEKARAYLQEQERASEPHQMDPDAAACFKDREPRTRDPDISQSDLAAYT